MQSISIQSTQNAAATISWQRCTQFSEFSLSSASFPNQLPDRHIIASLFSHHFFFHMSKNAMSIQFFYITDLHPTCLQPFFPFVLNHWTSSKIVDSLFMTYWPPLFIFLVLVNGSWWTQLLWFLGWIKRTSLPPITSFLPAIAIQVSWSLGLRPYWGKPDIQAFFLSDIFFLLFTTSFMLLSISFILIAYTICQ